MAHIVYNITFNDVVFQSLTGGPAAVVTGTIQVDYTSQTITAFGGGLVATEGSGAGATVYHFTNFSTSAVGAEGTWGASIESFTDPAGGRLNVSYTGEAPASLDGGFFIAGGIWGTGSGSLTSVAVVCFAAGTLIRTPHGDVPVEALEAGDTVLTASGARPVKWMGRRRLRRDFGRSRKHETVRIAAHALGPERPAQDLVVSPGHAICVDLMGEALILAKDLVNGATIRRERVDEVTFWHVELDSHDILLANNLPAESYLAMANRGFFEEGGATQDWIDEGKTLTHADFCRPVVADRAALAFLRERTLDRARELGWTPAVADDLHLVVDGETRRPIVDQGAAMFVFPATSRDVRLASAVLDPADLGLADTRTLGVMLSGLAFAGSDGDSRTIALDDPRLCDGVHALEGRFRWTNGALALDPQLWAGLKGDVSLVVSRRRGAVRGWDAPVAETEAPGRPRLTLVG